jgi:signal transduction histidine kinase
MLEFSKVSCFDSRPTPMDALIDDTVLMFRQTEARHLPVEVRLPAQPPVLTLDPILMRHALFNLLVNAAQATPAGSDTVGLVIELKAQRDVASGTPGWVLAVLDRGGGIAPEILDKIFVPFFTTHADGTGLGLPVVLHVALLHDGHVTAANRPDGGAQFAIWLPDTGQD